MDLKEASEINKPYYDYANNIIRVNVWFLAIHYVLLFMMDTEHNSPSHNIYIMAYEVLSALIFGSFLQISLLISTYEICKHHLRASIGSGIRSKLKALLICLIGLGLVVFTSNFMESFYSKWGQEYKDHMQTRKLSERHKPISRALFYRQGDGGMPVPRFL